LRVVNFDSESSLAWERDVEMSIEKQTISARGRPDV
jgi:hypothetical protein